MANKKTLEKRIKKFLIQIGLKKRIIPKLEVSEGHLGGYVVGKPAPGTWCPEIWDWSIKELGVKSMLDVGCGLGYCMEYFAKKGLEVAGVDGSPSAIEKNVLPKNVHHHDYTKGAWIPKQSYDLIWSSEFLEHVEQQYESNFFETFKKASKYLMVTFAIPGQRGHHHVNLQYEDYWIERFKTIGFEYDETLTNHARNLLSTTGMQGMQFRDKGLVFKKTN